MDKPLYTVTIYPIHHDDNFVTIKCPYCGDEHKHVKEKSLPMGEPIGLRISHCTDIGITENFNRGGYFIGAIPDDCPTGRKRLLAKSRN